MLAFFFFKHWGMFSQPLQVRNVGIVEFCHLLKLEKKMVYIRLASSYNTSRYNLLEYLKEFKSQIAEKVNQKFIHN